MHARSVGKRKSRRVASAGGFETAARDGECALAAVHFQPSLAKGAKVAAP
jgi:hypothetical protein